MNIGVQEKYKKYYNMENMEKILLVIAKPIINCKNSKQKTSDHFANSDVMVNIVSSAKRKGVL